MNIQEFNSLSVGDIVTVGMNSKETGRLFKVTNIVFNKVTVQLIEGELNSYVNYDSRHAVKGKDIRTYQYHALKKI